MVPIVRYGKFIVVGISETAEQLLFWSCTKSKYVLYRIKFIVFPVAFGHQMIECIYACKELLDDILKLHCFLNFHRKLSVSLVVCEGQWCEEIYIFDTLFYFNKKNYHSQGLRCHIYILILFYQRMHGLSLTQRYSTPMQIWQNYSTIFICG